jgi:hypothetical protein
MSKSDLKGRIKEAVGESTSISLDPFKDKPPKKEHRSVILPDIREVIHNELVLRELVPLVEMGAALAEEEHRIKAERQPIQDSIKTLLGGKPTGFMCGANRVKATIMTRKTLNRSKLLDAGVSTQVLQACTDEIPVYSVRVTPPGWKDDDEY